MTFNPVDTERIVDDARHQASIPHAFESFSSSNIRKCSLSIVSPVYMGEHCVEELVRQIQIAVEKITIDYEIILVEDGSPDDSWREIESLCQKKSLVKGIRLSRNFGQHSALTAGLRASTGDYVVVLDCDLQDDPAYIPMLLDAAHAGADIVYTRKWKRAHKGLKNVFGHLFHRVLNQLVSDSRLISDSEIGNYSLLHRRAVEAFLELNDYHFNYLGVLRWIGFKASYVNVKHLDRWHGESSYSFNKLVRLALDSIVSQSNTLLHLSIGLGFTFVVASFLSIAYIVFAYFMYGFQEGWASVIVSILMSTGIILMFLGVLGIYIGKIFEQSKQRPRYLVRKVLNFSE